MQFLQDFSLENHLAMDSVDNFIQSINCCVRGVAS